MLILHGDTASLAGKPWSILELRSEATAETTLRRLAIEIPGIFRSSPVEVFAPVKRRDLNVYELFSGPYVYVRSDNFKAVLRIKTVTGLVGLVTEGGCGRANKVIFVPDDYIQDLMRQDDAAFRARSHGVCVGSFVRVLDGGVRDFCGHVTKREGGRAEVTVELKTKKLVVDTPIRNLLHLPHVPRSMRVFYWSPLVGGLDDPSLVEEDRHTPVPVVPTAQEMAEQYTDESRRPSVPRATNISSFLRREARLGRTPRELLESCVAALVDGRIEKRPKNLFIVYCMLKERYMEADTRCDNWRALGKLMPRKDYVVLGDVFDFAEVSGLGIPRQTPLADVAQDGRSRRKQAKPTPCP